MERNRLRYCIFSLARTYGQFEMFDIENTTNITASVIGGYTHWTEFKEITNHKYNVQLAYNIVGLYR